MLQSEGKQASKGKIMDEEPARGNLALQAYLTEHQLSPRDVATQAGVPYVTVWSILRNKPVTALHAAQVRNALFWMTGVPYSEWIATLS